MRNQNVLKTTSQRVPPLGIWLQYQISPSLSNSCCKFSQQGSSFQLFLCPTKEAAVVSPLFPIALEHQEHLQHHKDVKVARFLR